MNTSSINGLSGNYIQATLTQLLATNSMNKSSAKNSATSQQSEFSKMLSDLSAGQSASTSGNASQLLGQTIGNFQASGISGQGQSLDPNSIAA